MLETAERAAIEAAYKLGLPPVKIRWRRSDGGRKFGWTDSNNSDEINLNISKLKSAYDVKAMTYHEIRHLWQLRTTNYLGDRRAAERDAQEWAYRETGYLVDDLAGEWEI